MTRIAYSETIEEFRSHFPVTAEWAYFETGSTGLIPDFVYEGMRRYADDRYYRGGDSKWFYEDGTVDTLEMMRRSKESLGKLLHCGAEDIAFGQSATQLFTMVTEGIDYAAEDNIVTVDGGWMGARYAWQKRQDEGLEIRFVEPEGGVVSAERLIATCDGHTRAIAVNLVENTTGYRIDIVALGRYCRERGILLFADGVQAIGALEVNIERDGIDFLVGNDYKWMMNFCGTGYAYVSPKIRGLIRHWGAGWMSDSRRFDSCRPRLELRADAGRYEIGQQHTDGIYGLGLVAEQNLRLGTENIEAYVLSLAAYLKERVRETSGMRLAYDIPSENCSQIVVIDVDGQICLTEEELAAAKIAAVGKTSACGSAQRFRFCLHYYNNRDDIDRFVDLVGSKRAKLKEKSA